MTDATPRTLLEAAREVLAARKVPMKVAEIWATIAESGTFRTTGKTPEATLATELMRATLGQRMSVSRARKDFFKDSDGKYGLVEWLDVDRRRQLEELETRMRTADVSKNGPSPAPGGVEALEERLEAMRRDAEAMAYVREQSDERAAVRAEIRTFLEHFSEAFFDLASFRATFDQKTRAGAEWGSFGLGGMSGAMFLNTLVKHLPDDADEVE